MGLFSCYALGMLSVHIQCCRWDKGAADPTTYPSFCLQLCVELLLQFRISAEELELQSHMEPCSWRVEGCLESCCVNVIVGFLELGGVWGHDFNLLTVRGIQWCTKVILSHLVPVFYIFYKVRSLSKPLLGEPPPLSALHLCFGGLENCLLKNAFEHTSKTEVTWQRC